MFHNENPKRAVVIYVNESLNAQKCKSMNDTEFEECVFIEFTSGDGQKVLFGCVYKSPNGSEDNEQKLFELFRRDDLSKYDCVCIAGDFNYPRIDWSGSWNGKNEDNFIECIRDAYLHQMVHKPTRRKPDQKSNILDLIFINDEQLVSDIDHLSPLGKSDHEVLAFFLYIADKVYQKKTDDMKFDMKKANYTKMRLELKIVDWTCLQEKSVNESWKYIKEIIHQTMDNNIPRVRQNKSNRQKPMWLDKSTMRLIKKKYNLYKKFLVSKNGRDYLKYLQTRNLCNRQIKNAKQDFEKKLSKECKQNPKCFWKYVQSKSKSKVGISPLMDKNGKLSESDQEKANTLNDFFSDVFTREKMDNVPHIETAQWSNGELLKNVEISKESVKLKLNKLNPNKAQGPDAIPARMLKELSDELAEPLSILFNKSVETMTIPDDWKVATVTPIFKKGTRTDPGNYRPVSLTCITCKILESYIRDAIVQYMTENSFYAKCQHGFRNNRSCVTQLLEVMEDFTQMIDKGEDIDVLYLDFKKAFDSVPHQRLLLKMKAYGITDNILNWTENFLTNRKQRVKVNNCLSKEAAVLSGIPQGSILGPILFTIFINDLPQTVTNICKIFADDTKLYCSPKSYDKMQQDIDSLLLWSDTWNLHFNVSKCKVLHIGKTNPEHNYKMNNGEGVINVTKCEEEKDLGVTFDKKLVFDKHINNVVNKANQRLAIIKRTFSYLNKDIFLRLYKALVRPLLEYGLPAWYPRLIRQSITIEKVQRRATKLIKEIKDLSYKRRLKYLKLPSLKARRKRGDLIQTYKIFNGIDDIDKTHFFNSPQTNILTRNSTDKIQKQRHTNNTRKYAYSYRVTNDWNKLTDNIKRASNTNTFKNLVDQHKILKNIMFDFDGPK